MSGRPRDPRQFETNGLEKAISEEASESRKTKTNRAPITARGKAQADGTKFETSREEEVGARRRSTLCVCVYVRMCMRQDMPMMLHMNGGSIHKCMLPRRSVGDMQCGHEGAWVYAGHDIHHTYTHGVDACAHARMNSTHMLM